MISWGEVCSVVEVGGGAMVHSILLCSSVVAVECSFSPFTIIIFLFILGAN